MMNTIYRGPEGEDGFFVVLREDDARLRRHGTDIAARAEAERLARENPGRRFYVLGTQAAAVVSAPPVEWKTPVFEMPF